MAAIKFIVFAKLVHCSSEILGALRLFLFLGFPKEWDVQLSFGLLSRYSVTRSIAKIKYFCLIHDNRAAKILKPQQKMSAKIGPICFWVTKKITRTSSMGRDKIGFGQSVPSWRTD